MGWLGWTERDTLDTTIPAIMRAYDERVKMLRMCFGGSAEETEPARDESAAPVNVQSALHTLAGKS